MVTQHCLLNRQVSDFCIKMTKKRQKVFELQEIYYDEGESYVLCYGDHSPGQTFLNSRKTPGERTGSVLPQSRDLDAL